MGMYTELFVTARIKPDENVIQPLKLMLRKGISLNAKMDHPLFSTDRWAIMLTCSSYYFTPVNVNHFEYDSIANYWSLVSYSSFKNYDGEVEAFFDWLKPFVDDEPGTLIGYHRYEEYEEPTLVYL